jgi:large subunit ribosomal protein L21
MYAVIKTGGKQYKVQEGDVIRVELLADSEEGKVTFDEVLMVGGTDSPKIGKPTLEGAKVEATVLGQAKGPKVLHFRKMFFGWTRGRGHRQKYTEVKITGITA